MFSFLTLLQQVTCYESQDFDYLSSLSSIITKGDGGLGWRRSRGNDQSNSPNTEILPKAEEHKTMEYCRWTGSSPICYSSCNSSTEYEVLKDTWGDSSKGACWSGYKGLCCANGFPEEQNKPKLNIDSCAKDEKTVRRCKFPFHYKGKLHYKCIWSDHTEDWCYTTEELDWGNCRPCDNEKKVKKEYYVNPNVDFLLNIGASETETV